MKGDTAALKFERRFTEGAARKKAEDQEKIDRRGMVGCIGFRV